DGSWTSDAAPKPSRGGDVDRCSRALEEQKAVNLRSNRNVILTTGCNQWERGLDVVVDCEAGPGTRREHAPASRRGVGDEVGRALALRGTRRRLPARGREWHGPRVLGEARQG